jgi:hypothetical protein
MRLLRGERGESAAVLLVQRALQANHRKIAYARARLAEHHLEQAARQAKGPDDGAIRPGFLAAGTEYLRVAHLRAAYPYQLLDIAPTRMGNVLRRYEVDGGRALGLDLATVVPHLRLVATETDLRHLGDRREAYELSVHLVGTSILTTALSVGWLWRAGLWMLLSLVPYFGAVLL